MAKKIRCTRHSLLEGLARRFRAAYIRSRNAFEQSRQNRVGYSYRPGPQWDGGYNKREYYYKPIWPSLAAVCLDNRIVPEVWINAVFMNWTADRAPEPNMFKGKKLLHYHSAADHDGYKMWIRDEFRAQKLLLRAESDKIMDCGDYSVSEAQKLILVDKGLCLSYLFRYCVAVSEKIADIEAALVVDALQQYVMDRSLYDEIWADWIPVRLHKLADKILSGQEEYD